MLSTPLRTSRVRMLLFLKRRPDMTPEQFNKHWAEKHGPLFESLDVVKKNILKYERAYTNPASSAVAQALQLSAPDFDGTLVLEAESVEKLAETFGSEEYVQTVAPDEANFVDRPKCQVLLQQVEVDV